MSGIDFDRFLKPGLKMHQIIEQKVDLAGHVVIRAMLTNGDTTFLYFTDTPTQEQVDAEVEKIELLPTIKPSNIEEQMAALAESDILDDLLTAQEYYQAKVDQITQRIARIS